MAGRLSYGLPAVLLSVRKTLHEYKGNYHACNSQHSTYSKWELDGIPRHRSKAESVSIPQYLAVQRRFQITPLLQTDGENKTNRGRNSSLPAIMQNESTAFDKEENAA